MTSNRSAKSLAASIRILSLTGFSSWLRTVSCSWKPSADRARADHRELGVDVHRAGAGHEEEPRLEVLEIVGRERVQALAVDGQHPLRQKPRVEREEAGGVGRGGLDITAAITHHERVSVQNRDQIAHVTAPAAAPGRRAGSAPSARWRPRRPPSRAGSPRWRWPHRSRVDENTSRSVIDHGVGGAVAPRDRNCTLVDGHPPVLGALRTQIEPEVPLDSAEQRLAAAFGQLREEHIGGVRRHSSSSSSARMIRAAASINARCENACGKLPRWRPVSASNSSAYNPSGEAMPQQLLHQVLGLLALAHDGQRRHEPERADQEGALLARQPVVGLVGAVAQHKAVLAELLGDRDHRLLEPLVVGRQEAERAPPAGWRHPASRCCSAGAARPAR